MVSHAEMRNVLGEAVGSGDPDLSMADRLCHACVRLLDVDGAAISVMLEGSTQGTIGSSGELSRQLDELQFTFGEGPCRDAVRRGAPVIAENLADPGEQRWLAYAGSALGLGVRAVYALPISLANSFVGALDLYRHRPGPLEGDSRLGGLMAAELAVLPVLALMSADTDLLAAADRHEPWDQLASLARVEVYQATGMLMGQLGVGPAEALVRLRAHAFAHDLTASRVAWLIVDRQLSLEPDHKQPDLGGMGGAS
jgi:GAF domain